MIHLENHFKVLLFDLFRLLLPEMELNHVADVEQVKGIVNLALLACSLVPRQRAFRELLEPALNIPKSPKSRDIKVFLVLVLFLGNVVDYQLFRLLQGLADKPFLEIPFALLKEFLELVIDFVA